VISISHLFILLFTKFDTKTLYIYHPSIHPSIYRALEAEEARLQSIRGAVDGIFDAGRMVYLVGGKVMRIMAVFASFILIFPLTGPQPLRPCRPWALSAWAIAMLNFTLILTGSGGSSRPLSSIVSDLLDHLPSLVNDWDDIITHHMNLLVALVGAAVFVGLMAIIAWAIKRQPVVVVLPPSMDDEQHVITHHQKERPSSHPPRQYNAPRLAPFSEYQQPSSQDWHHVSGDYDQQSQGSREEGYDGGNLDHRTIDTFRVVELKEELRRRRLSVDGNKAMLVRRLKEASSP